MVSFYLYNRPSFSQYWIKIDISFNENLLEMLVCNTVYILGKFLTIFISEILKSSVWTL